MRAVPPQRLREALFADESAATQAFASLSFVRGLTGSIVTRVFHSDDEPIDDDLERVLRDAARRSMHAYRTLIDDERFWPWLMAASPAIAL